MDGPKMSFIQRFCCPLFRGSSVPYSEVLLSLIQRFHCIPFFSIVCTNILNVKDLQGVLQSAAKEGGMAPSKICQELELPDKICTDSITTDEIASQYLDQDKQGEDGGDGDDDDDCWEEIVQLLCKELGLNEMAEKVAIKYDIQYSKYCT